MADLPSSLSLEAIASGIVGLLLAGGLIKRVIDGYIEAKRTTTSAATSPMLTAVALSWDRDQQERFMQIMEDIAQSLRRQADSQVALANQQQHDMQAQISWLVDQLSNVPAPPRRKRVQPKKGS
jgi:hypothetical protein